MASLGVTLDGGGADIAVFSRHAARIEVCLFDDDDRETRRVPLDRQGDVHRGHLAGVGEGQRYGLRAHGPWAPESGHGFDPAKLLVDPYARRLDRPFAHRAELMERGAETAPFMPKAVIERPAAAAPRARRDPPGIVYEIAVKAFTRRHPQVPETLRGTVAALGHAAAIEYLKKLGVDTVELMPLAAFIDERHLPALGLANAWGYNPVTFMAPDPRLAPGGFPEIRAAVARLHEAGLNVVLDVVYNHTGESDAQGTTLSLRGLDAASYYRHDGGFRLIDDTGCGNTVAAESEPVLRLILDAMRLWATETGIDGFRFDLATILGRGPQGFSRDAPFFAALEKDPLLGSLVMIAEPWDVGPDGYRLGQFPPDWREWNDRYRDDLRRFWRGERGMIGTLATRLAGSSDVFDPRRRRPSSSVNFVAAHDGFTLRDLVAYADKHNEANGENNRDGADSNWSWNNGVEGETGDEAVREARAADVRALLASLLVSRGTAMLTAGDEFGRSQKGNNNAYAQDNELTWLDWEGADASLVDFVRAAIAVRRAHPSLAADRFLTGAAMDSSGLPDVAWLRADGEAMRQDDWNDPERRLLGAAFHDFATGDRTAVWLNAGRSPARVRLPPPRAGGSWRLILDRDGAADEAVGETADIPARSVVVLAEKMQARRSAAPGDRLIDELAAAAGIQPVWWTVAGERHDVGPETKRALLAAMGLDIASGRGVADGLERLRRSAVSPPQPAKCHLSPALAGGGKVFGLAAHLYALRGAKPTALGNLTTLGEFCATAREAGAAFAGINPLHHLFPTDRGRASPYQPSDRRFIDPIHIDIDAVPGAGPSDEEARNAIASLSERRHVDYEAAWAVIRRSLAGRFAAFEAEKPGPLWAAFQAFCGADDALHRHAVFEAIAAQAGTVDRRTWPEALRAAGSGETARFAEAHAGDVLFGKWLQWVCDLQLAQNAQAGSAVYADLALGTAFDGGEAWADPDLFAAAVSLGAPPDPFSALGQVWNLAPFRPQVLIKRGLEPYRRILRVNMRHAGMLRIDHVLGLMRQFWVPRGAEGKDGAYVSFPTEALMRLVAEESRARPCMVVGEDLGTVPEGLRERLAEGNFLSYKVLWFERDGAVFRPPEAYPRLSLACLGSHDLPTFAGWAAGAHLELDRRLKRSPDEARQRRDYEIERAELQTAFDAAGLARGDLKLAAHEFLSRTGSGVAMVQVDDLFGETEQLNVPGTDREYPNWRRRDRRPVGDILSDGRSCEILAILRKERSAN
ncbi:MAG: glycogen debranching protein GlgX [Parvibaculaceae bacterium]